MSNRYIVKNGFATKTNFLSENIFTLIGDHREYRKLRKQNDLLNAAEVVLGVISFMVFIAILVLAGEGAGGYAADVMISMAGGAAWVAVVVLIYRSATYKRLFNVSLGRYASNNIMSLKDYTYRFLKHHYSDDIQIDDFSISTYDAYPRDIKIEAAYKVDGVKTRIEMVLIADSNLKHLLIDSFETFDGWLPPPNIEA